MILSHCLLILFSFVARTISIHSHSFLPFPHGALRTTNRQSNNDKTTAKLDKFVRLRGGSTTPASGGDDKNTDGKIKGVCIGIDLGTTYR